jgi:type VI secretion system secreted protein Hcp
MGQSCHRERSQIHGQIGYRRAGVSTTMKRWKSWIRSSVFCLTLVGMSMAPFAEADAALNAYLNLKGQKTGQIKGSVSKKGREGMIEIISLNHEVVSPRDAASGLPTGKRQHKPFVITKPLDKSSPLLNNMLVNNESIPEWKLDVYDSNSKSEKLMYTVKLTNASIASIRLVTDANGELREEISFTYQKIEWTWVDGGITAMDDWESPVAKKK